MIETILGWIAVVAIGSTVLAVIALLIIAIINLIKLTFD